MRFWVIKSKNVKKSISNKLYGDRNIFLDSYHINMSISSFETKYLKKKNPLKRRQNILLYKICIILNVSNKKDIKTKKSKYGK